jgi:hypothetical protein
MPADTRESVIGREESHELVRRLVAERASAETVALAVSNHHRWVLVDNGIAAGVLDIRRGVSTEEMVRRQRSRDAELKRQRPSRIKRAA